MEKTLGARRRRKITDSSDDNCNDIIPEYSMLKPRYSRRASAFYSSEDADISDTHSDASSIYSGSFNYSTDEPKELHRFGVTLDGLRRFNVPNIPSTIGSWFMLNPFSCLTWISVLLTLYISSPKFPAYYILLGAIFWRFAYNIGAGLILSFQSDTQFLTNWIIRVREQPFSSKGRLLAFLLRTSMGGTEVLYDRSIAPAFPAWMIFRSFASLVELNDVLAFTLTAFRFAQFDVETCDKPWFPSDLVNCIEEEDPKGLIATLPVAMAYCFGTLIIVLSVYGKFKAQQTVGQFSWYWADFFFRVEQQELTYEGIFELFPHPMYTVGYAWTYGCALLSRNYVVLALALASHFSQMMFLWRVEAPHIDKLYNAEAENSKEVALEMERSANVFVIQNFDIFRSSDIALVLMIVFYTSNVVLGSRKDGIFDSDEFFMFQAMAWRTISTLTIGGVLLRQSKTKFFTKHFINIGSTAQQGFESWKRLCNMMRSLRHVSFLLCAVRFFDCSIFSVQDEIALHVTRILLGLMLGSISLWAFYNCYGTLGDFGWFYGDFFLRPPAGERQLTYSGIYRFLNNPDVYLGHLWMYGMALICNSFSLVLVAVLSHALEILFLQVVEKPHLRMVYKHHVRQGSSALEVVVRKRAKKVTNSESARFFANWVRHPISTGALAPSSRQLAVAMCDETNMTPDAVVVELGPGTGPFTEEIFSRIDTEKEIGNYIGFELNEEFYRGLITKFSNHREDFLLESAEKISQNLRMRGFDKADIVISGLPWSIFPLSLQKSILEEISASLKPGGKFATFAYLQGLVLPAGQSFKRLLSKYFSKVERSPVVWKNIPPAFVYRCTK